MASNKPVKLFYTYNNGPKTKLLVDPDIEWEDLYKLIAKKVELAVSETWIHMYNKDEDSWVVLLRDEFPLDPLTQLRVKKIQAVPSCLQGLIPKNKIWTNSKGEILSEIKVYFDRKLLPKVKFNGDPLQCSTIIQLANNYWNCAEVENDEKVKIGKQVPGFKDLGADCNIDDADIRVAFESGGSYSKLGTEARSSDKSEPTMVLDLEGKTSASIQFEIVHEFGHALGLYHEHQHPEYLAVMKDYLDDMKMFAAFRRPESEDMNDFNLQYKALADTNAFQFKPQYDPRSIMHYPTYREFLRDKYVEEFKTEKDLDERLKKDGIDATQLKYKVLKGFWRHINFVCGEPSDMDKRAVAEAYYTYHKALKGDDPSPSEVSKKGDAAATSKASGAASSSAPKGGDMFSGDKLPRDDYMGRKAPKNLADLMLIKNKATKGRFQLTNKIETVWRDIGGRLGMEHDQLDSIREDNRKNADALKKVFGLWFSHAGSLPNADSYPLSWQGLYNLLNDVGKSEDAKALFEFLDAMPS